MEVTLKIRPDIAASLQQRGKLRPEAQRLQRVMKQLGVHFEPLHPGTEDSVLASYFRIVVDDEAHAKRVLAALRAREGVEAAYVKPPDELP